MVRNRKNPFVSIFFLVLLAGALLAPALSAFAQTSSTVSTGSAAVQANSVTLNGSVNPRGADTSAWFEWGTKSDALTRRTNAAHVGEETSSVNYSYTLNNLDPNTTYYFRAVAYNAFGIARGSISSFVTGNTNVSGSAPGVSTSGASDTTTTGTGVSGTTVGGGSLIALTQLATFVTESKAQLNGLALPGYQNVFTTGWFEWGTNSSLGFVTPIRSLGIGASLGYAVELTGLSPNVTYYYRAVVQNQLGIARGNTLSFTTRAGSAVVSPPAVTPTPVEPTPTPQPKPAPAPTPKPAPTEQPKEELLPQPSVEDQSIWQRMAALFAAFDFFDSTLGKVLGWLVAIILLLLLILLLLWLYERIGRKRTAPEEEA